jgi:hypothetical protein
MNSKLKYFLLFSLIIFYNIITSVSLYSQQATTSNEYKNSEGKEYWICFQKNYKESKQSSSRDELQLELFISGDNNAKVT